MKQHLRMTMFSMCGAAIGPLATVAVAFLTGGLPFGVWLPRWLNQGDPRHMGSGNIGATNVYRMAGWKTAVGVYVLDFVKGWGITWWMLAHFSSPWPELAMIGVVAGHIFSVFLGGRGGKGVAVASGVLLALSPWTWFFSAMVWAVVFYTTRYAAVASLTACSGAVIISGIHFWFFQGALGMIPSLGLVESRPLFPPGITPAFSLIGIWMFIVWSHRANLGRLYRGQENKI
jgi:acyl-phosphate glycerol 3-phosphate acyltransferase